MWLTGYHLSHPSNQAFKCQLPATCLADNVTLRVVFDELRTPTVRTLLDICHLAGVPGPRMFPLAKICATPGCIYVSYIYQYVLCYGTF